MTDKRTPIIVGNWKMNLTTAGAIKLVTEIKNKFAAEPSCDIVVAPPFTALNAVDIALQGSKIQLAGQNVYFEDSGAFTGEVSVAMLEDVGCAFILVGHSERRHIFNETHEVLAKKVAVILRRGLTPILCVGESLRERQDKQTFEVLEEQIRRATANLTDEEMSEIILAYEPVWAIGTGENASPAQVQEIHHHLRNFISKRIDKPTANQLRILYGGSVKVNNATALLAQGDVDGLLIGGASLNPDEFAQIITDISEMKS